MKPSCKPLDVQTKQKPLYRQKPATTSIQLHTGQLIHLIEAPREEKQVTWLRQFDAECTYIKCEKHKISRLHSRVNLWSELCESFCTKVAPVYMSHTHPAHKIRR